MAERKRSGQQTAINSFFSKRTKTDLPETSNNEEKNPPATSNNEEKKPSVSHEGTDPMPNYEGGSTSMVTATKPSNHSSNDKMCGPWTIDECRSLIKEIFSNKNNLHSCYTCAETGCVGVGGGKFNHSWLNSKNWWLAYIKDEGMYCLVCKKHQMKNPQNQTTTFASSPSIRFKVDAITSHSNSKSHAAALESELLQQVSCFHQEVTKKAEVETSVLESVFSSAYFLMKEYISNRKLIPLLKFIEKVFDADGLKYFNHRSARSQSEIFLSLGQSMKSRILEKVQDSKAFGLLTDEVCDVSVTENLITFIQYFCQASGKVETSFLSCQDVLRNHQGAGAEAIAALILQELKDDNLEYSKMTGLTTDGAAVMTGRKAGVAARLREVNPTLINVHCICHRLALSCTDSNESITYIKTIEILLRQLWQFFENSPKRMAAYLKMQSTLKSVMLGDGASRVVTKRLKKACRTRWLSLDASVKAVQTDFEAILQTLSLFSETDATACGLLKKMQCLKFLGTIYILREILPILAELSCFFQKDAINFSAIAPAISLAKQKLQLVLDNKSPIQTLSSDIESFTEMSSEITWSKKASDELETLLANYVKALISNIDSRFNDSSRVIAAFAIFDPMLVPTANDVGFQEHGNANIQLLAEHYYKDNMTDTDRLKSEWLRMKYHIIDVIQPNMPNDIKTGVSSTTSTVWYFRELLKPSMRQYFPMLAFIAEVAASLPVSNAWPERGASALKTIKTKQRNRLSNEMMEAVLHIAVNGPTLESDDGQSIIKSAVKSWLDIKKRRRLPNPPRLPTSAIKDALKEVQDTGVQTDPVVVSGSVGELVSQVKVAVKRFHLEQEMCDDSESDWSDNDF